MRSHLKCEGVPMQKKGGNSHEDKSCDIGSGSYTHLTQPTNREV